MHLKSYPRLPVKPYGQQCRHTCPTQCRHTCPTQCRHTCPTQCRHTCPTQCRHTCPTRVSSSAVTRSGSFLLSVEPSPSRPYSPLPKVNSLPSAVTTAECLKPQATWTRQEGSDNKGQGRDTDSGETRRPPGHGRRGQVTRDGGETLTVVRPAGHLDTAGGGVRSHGAGEVRSHGAGVRR